MNNLNEVEISVILESLNDKAYITMENLRQFKNYKDQNSFKDEQHFFNNLKNTALKFSEYSEFKHYDYLIEIIK